MYHNISYINKLDQRHEAAYFFKHFYFTELLPKEQATLLSYLIAMENNPKINRLKDDPTFFECNVAGFMNSKLKGWSVHELKAALTNLVNAGYVMKRIVKNNTTCISLNHKMLDKLYNEWLDKEYNDSTYINRISLPSDDTEEISYL